MGIPYGTTYTVTVGGRAVKTTDCGRCGVPYVYVVERKAAAGTSVLWLDNDGAKERAASDARVALSAALADAVEPAACPGCGWYQPDMVTEARRRRGRWLVRGVGFAAVFSTVFFLLAVLTESAHTYDGDPVLWKITGALALTAGVFAALRHVRCTKWDPNADAAWKASRNPKEAGLAMPKSEYDRLEAPRREPPGGGFSYRPTTDGLRG